MVPEAHTFQDLKELSQEDSSGKFLISMDLMLAFPFVVHVSKVQDLRVPNSMGIIIKMQMWDTLAIWNQTHQESHTMKEHNLTWMQSCMNMEHYKNQSQAVVLQIYMYDGKYLDDDSSLCLLNKCKPITASSSGRTPVSLTLEIERRRSPLRGLRISICKVHLAQIMQQGLH